MLVGTLNSKCILNVLIFLFRPVFYTPVLSIWTRRLSSALFSVRVQYVVWNVELTFNLASKGGHSRGVLTVIVLR